MRTPNRQINAYLGPRFLQISVYDAYHIPNMGILPVWYTY
jgi:hypothetical protein